jgi:hypothetical protein
VAISLVDWDHSERVLDILFDDNAALAGLNYLREDVVDGDILNG